MLNLGRSERLGLVSFNESSLALHNSVILNQKNIPLKDSKQNNEISPVKKKTTIAPRKNRGDFASC
jgi:hypothetical protein